MERIVITGYGALSPLGLNADESWRGAVDGRSGVGPITLFDISDFPVKYAAEVKNFDPKTVLDHKEVRRQDRFEILGFAAAKEAIEHSCLDIKSGRNERVGVAMSSGAGGLGTMDEQFGTLHANGPRTLSPFGIPRIMSNGAAGLISINFGLRGPSFCTASACASGADGIGMATILLRAGVVDVMIAGGAEAPVTALAVGAFDRIGAVSHRESGAPSPFSADRDGLIVGEGAAALVLETLEHARARGATIYGEIIGYGASADAFHITAPTEDGSGSAHAIRRALDDAHITPAEVDYVNAHGTGTTLNDEAETRAIKLALGQRAYEIPVSSTKSMTGHMMGATGALEAVFCIRAISEGVVPPTINYREKDAECDLDYVPNKARQMPVRIVMSNSFGFGGHNSVLIFKKFEG
jgi:3-oxoacyl-[acyl-carrier-protein] synthase II